MERFLRSFRSAVWLLVAVVSVASVSGHAQTSSEDLDRKAYDLYQQVFSPFCAGRSLNDCPSSKAHELKAEMRKKLEQGIPPEVVLEDVFAQFGDQYRAVPAYQGFGRLVWWVPVGFVLVGAVVALVIARGRRIVQQSGPQKGGEMAHSPSGSEQDELRKQIERELAALD